MKEEKTTPLRQVRPEVLVEYQLHPMRLSVEVVAETVAERRSAGCARWCNDWSGFHSLFDFRAALAITATLAADS